jgi:hypothetical protein
MAGQKPRKCILFPPHLKEDGSDYLTIGAESHTCFIRYPAEIRIEIFKQAILSELPPTDTLFRAVVCEDEDSGSDNSDSNQTVRVLHNEFIALLKRSFVRLVNTEALEAAKFVYRTSKPLQIISVTTGRAASQLTNKPRKKF